MTHELKYCKAWHPHQSIILYVGNFVSNFHLITNFSWNSDLGKVLSGVGQVTVNILANDWLLVGAGHVVPFDS